MQLSKNFWLSEFVKSQAATRIGINNTPSNEDIKNLSALAINVLQPVRDYFNKPVVINSGYRAPAVNRAIGGSNSSQHSLGEAADIEIPGVSNIVIAQWIRDNVSFDQLILEGYDANVGPHSGWVHVSFREGRRRQSVLTATFVAGRAHYTQGIYA